MVNNSTSTKSKILSILRESKAPVSGEVIAGCSEVSRVAVWKSIQSLQQSGYRITHERTGYVLKEDMQDSLFPWEFGDKESFFFHCIETESTMDEAKKIAESHPQQNHIQIVTADRQTKGRGSSNKKWTTAKGSLACTVITRNTVSAAESRRITMASQIAIAKALKNLTGRTFYTRWPNDVWSSEGKVCGILDELAAQGNLCSWINIGIGVNLSCHPKIKNADQAAFTKGSLSRKKMLLAFLDEFKFQERIACEDSSALEKQWNSLCMDSGKKIKSAENGKEFTFKKINGLGFAVLDSEGKESIVAPGKISLIKEMH